MEVQIRLLAVVEAVESYTKPAMLWELVLQRLRLVQAAQEQLLQVLLRRAGQHLLLVPFLRQVVGVVWVVIHHLWLVVMVLMVEVDQEAEPAEQELLHLLLALLLMVEMPVVVLLIRERMAAVAVVAQTPLAELVVDQMVVLVV